MFKSCSKCGKIHDTKYKCNFNRTFTGGEERKLRSQYSWTKKSQEIRERANFLCEVCKDIGEITFENIEVHHIIKVKDDKSKLLENENLICLCQEHHKQADNNEIDQDYLINLAKMRENGGVSDSRC